MGLGIWAVRIHIFSCSLVCYIFLMNFIVTKVLNLLICLFEQELAYSRGYSKISS